MTNERFPTFVTEAAPPARLTAALPRLLTGPVQTAGRRHTALTLLPVPARVTSADREGQGDVWIGGLIGDNPCY